MDSAKKIEGERFNRPSREHYPVNMWFWDDTVTKEEISFQLDRFLEMGIYQIFIHPMWGTTVDYLSEEFFILIAHAVSEMKKRGQKYWIYDEYNWPSGPAGGKLLEEQPWTRGKFLRIREVSVQPGYKADLMLPGKVYAVKRLTDPAAALFEDVTGECGIYAIDGSGGGTPATAEWHRLVVPNSGVNDYTYKIFYLENEKSVLVTSVWGEHSNYAEGYLDTLNPKAAQAFIESTYEKYKRYIGHEFGGTVMGVFTDEPCVACISEFEANGLPWYDGLEEDFLAWAGYGIGEKLPLLYMPGDSDEAKRVKMDFWRFLGLRFKKSFISALSGWCADNGLLLTGHMCGEETLWTNMMQSVDIFDDLAEFHVPGIDSIFSKQNIDAPNFNIAGKIIGSVGRFYGKNRLLCETYTGSGWDLRFSDMRRIANRLILLGANMIQYMGSYYTLDNMRKLLPICYPPSHSYNNPLMGSYLPFGEYVARLQYLSQITKPAGKALLVMPTLASFALGRPTSVFMGYHDEGYTIKHMDMTLEIMVNALLCANVEYDVASDTLPLSCEGDTIELYGIRYDWLVLPAMHCTDAATEKVVRAYLKNGGKTLLVSGFFGEAPKFSQENKLDRLDRTQFPGAYMLSLDLAGRAEADSYAIGAAREIMGDHVALSAEHGGGVLISERSGEGFTLSFIVNDTGEYKDLSGVLPHGRCVFLDPETGMRRRVEADGSKFCAVLAPYECLVLVAFENGENGEDIPELAFGEHIGKPCGETVAFDSGWSFEALEDNALIPEKRVLKQDKNSETPLLDPSGGIVSPAGSIYGYEQPAGHNIPKETGIGSSDRFSVYSEFEVIDIMPLKLMYESGFVDRIYINGSPMTGSYDKKVWGIDNKEADISKYISKGKNTIVFDCRLPGWNAPFKLPFFAVLGEFRLGADGGICAPWPQIEPAPWTGQGYRYYSGKGRYCSSFTLKENFGRILLDIPTLDPAQVVINGAVLPKRHWAPFAFDLTDHAKPGTNELSIVFDACYSNLLEKPCDSGLIKEPVIYKQ